MAEKRELLRECRCRKGDGGVEGRMLAEGEGRSKKSWQAESWRLAYKACLLWRRCVDKAQWMHAQDGVFRGTLHEAPRTVAAGASRGITLLQHLHAAISR
jgi:hypothetical protein